MADIQLFHINGEVRELTKQIVPLEKELQILIEKNMGTFFGVRFLKSEYVTSNGGRIDSLGLDENNCPVILEYKRTVNENVINQGLFYLDWLMDHKADFQLLVMEILGKEIADEIDWSMPRLVCVASGFTKYDEYAVNQIDRNIDLVRYIQFGKDLIAFEQLESKTAKPLKETYNISNNYSAKKSTGSFEERYQSAPKEYQDLYISIKNYILDLGDHDVIENQLKHYTAFKKLKNIACLYVNQTQVTLFLKLDPSTIELTEGFTRDLSQKGHWGTCDLQVVIKIEADFEKAKPLIDRAYEEN